MGKEATVEKYHMSLMQLTIFTGFVAGVFGTLFCYLAHTFQFTKISPAVIFTSLGFWKSGWVGITVSAFLYGLLSILMALLYYSLLRKQKSIFAGVAFGIGIFVLIFYVLNPLLPGIKPLKDINTILTELCFFIVYGTFIGYSISYEYNEQLYLKARKEAEKR